MQLLLLLSRCCSLHTVGNISYDATEQQLLEIFSSVGQVVNFRLVHDKETGRVKGYAFAEYADRETASSAVRNLNNVDFHGRSLRVDMADQEYDAQSRGGDRQQTGKQLYRYSGS